MLAVLHDKAVKDDLIHLVLLCTDCLFLKLSYHVALLCIYLQSVSVLFGRINVFIIQYQEVTEGLLIATEIGNLY